MFKKVTFEKSQNKFSLLINQQKYTKENFIISLHLINPLGVFYLRII